MSRDKSLMLVWLLLQATGCPVCSGEWTAKVVHDIDALVSSCVVIPCSFAHRDGLSSSALRGSWFLKDKPEQYVFHEDSDDIIENFRGRTELIGRLRDGNCSLEIMNVKDHDDGLFCFKLDMTNDDRKKFAFLDNCARLKMLADPPKPKLNSPKKAVQGQPFTITCSVVHTCPSHRPVLTWSGGPTDPGVIEIHKNNNFGSWEIESILTFLPEEKDDDTQLSCMATFSGGETSSAALQLYVKRKELYLHIILPLVVGLGTAVIFGAFCVLMKIKYKNRITDLQNRGSSRVRNHISRVSQRIRSSRFMQSRPRNPVELSAYDTPNNTVSSTSKNHKVSKPRCPSPKSQPWSSSDRPVSDHNGGSGDSYDNVYTNTADLNLYGNI
ncbi:unnamed protein product [Lota lota]